MRSRRAGWLAELELPEEATSADIAVAYKQLVQVWHPDRFGHDRQLQLRAEARLKKINEAYRCLLEYPAPPPNETSYEAPRADEGRKSNPAGERVTITITCPTCRCAVRIDAASRPPFRVRCPHCQNIFGIGFEPEANHSASRSERPSPSHDAPAPQSGSKDLRIGWVIVAILAAGFFVIASLQGPDRPRELVRPTRTPTPPLPVTSTVPPMTSASLPCDGGTSDRPVSGRELGGRHRGGRGRITIENGTSSDAVAVLTEATDGLPRRAVFVRSGEKGLITSIPIGTYRLRFQFGDLWLASRRFCTISATSEFAEAFGFAEETVGDRIEYQTFSVTLHTSPSGNASTTMLGNGPLLLPPQ